MGGDLYVGGVAMIKVRYLYVGLKYQGRTVGGDLYVGGVAMIKVPRQDSGW